jgi:NAD(P)-dependent dehydrogenase (short-subunit alcohol dehydrogenase family)
MTATDMTEAQLAEAPFRERIEAMTQLRRVGAPEEIAEAVARLISPAAKFVAGSVITVSGGR